MPGDHDRQNTALNAGTGPKDAASARWTVDDILNTEYASDFRLSPDGQRVVWVKSMPDKEKGLHVSHLMLTTQAGKEVQLTRGDVDCAQPRWSPDREHIAFVAARPLPKEVKIEGADEQPKPQLWVMYAQGGEPWHLTASAREVQNFEWAGADAIVFAAQEDRTLHELTLKEHKDESTVVDDEDHEPPVRLFRVALKDRQVVRLSDNTDRIRALALSPDGRYAVTIHERSLRYEYDNRIKPLVFVYDLQDGTRQQVLDDLYVQHVVWAPAGDGFYAVSAYGRHLPNVMATIGVLYFYDLPRGAAVQVPLDWERGLALWDQVIDTTGDGFVALLADGVRPRAARYIRTGAGGWERAWLSGGHAGNLLRLVMGADGKTLLYDETTASMPEQWFRARLDGAQIVDPAPITHLNAHLGKKNRARTEVVRWRGALDDEVEGILYYPHDYQPGQRYPLVVMIHGGPAWVDLDVWEDTWSHPQNLINQRGAFVFKPNYHGSAFYGLDWLESIGQGRYYDLEVPDIERGVDALIERGLVDPARLGVMGWSNGAILTIALTVTTDRYRAASAGAGDVDWVSDWANCAFGACFDHFYMGATPIENPDLYREKSPFYRLDRVRTPTLIFFGDQDRAVPTQQGWMHFRALQQLEQTEVRFVLFPGEEHGFKKQSSWRRKLNEELAWFDKHLFENLPAKNAALKPNSPLDVALKRRHAARADGRLGVEAGGLLAPETVPYKGLELGRFEVTRAQYQAFDADYTFPAGTQDYPANGIAFDQAVAYCAWLSDWTGEVYRLGEQAEMEPLYLVEGRENTLDHWAGYTVNPEDAARLREAASGLGGNAPLLYPVGHFQAADPEQPVFDLGGNVAEWAIGPDGSGRIMGGSADTPADRRTDRRQPAPEYVGFRVIKGPKGG